MEQVTQEQMAIIAGYDYFRNGPASQAIHDAEHSTYLTNEEQGAGCFLLPTVSDIHHSSQNEIPVFIKIVGEFNGSRRWGVLAYPDRGGTREAHDYEVVALLEGIRKLNPDCVAAKELGNVLRKRVMDLDDSMAKKGREYDLEEKARRDALLAIAGPSDEELADLSYSI